MLGLPYIAKDANFHEILKMLLNILTKNFMRYYYVIRLTIILIGL